MKYFLLKLVLSCFMLSWSTAQSRPRKQVHPQPVQAMFEEYREKRLDLIAQFIPSSPVIFEAGGHFGEDTVKFAAKWPDAKIIAFEANPNAFKKFTTKTCDIKNIIGYNLAVNDYNGIASFYICHQNIKNKERREGASSLLEPSNEMSVEYAGPKIEVPCVILDDWCKTQAVDHIDFMWLDLEGVELQILSASPQMLSKVKVIYTETNLFNFRVGTTRFVHLKKFLHRSGFRLLVHWLHPNGKQGDAIFLKKEIFDAIQLKKQAKSL